MSASADAETGSRASTESCSTVSALTGFDPARIRLSRRKGWRLPANAVNVARPSKWGNPFVVGKDGTREQCVGLFYQLVKGFIDFGGRLSVDEQLAYFRRTRRALDSLRGKDLACWCALDGKPCHADVLLAIANDRPLPAHFPSEITLPRVRLGMLASEVEKKMKRRTASAGEAGTATTPQSGVVHEHAASEAGDAQ